MQDDDYQILRLTLFLINKNDESRHKNKTDSYSYINKKQIKNKNEN